MYKTNINHWECLQYVLQVLHIWRFAFGAASAADRRGGSVQVWTHQPEHRGALPATLEPPCEFIIQVARNDESFSAASDKYIFKILEKNFSWVRSCTELLPSAVLTVQVGRLSMEGERTQVTSYIWIFWKNGFQYYHSLTFLHAQLHSFIFKEGRHVDWSSDLTVSLLCFSERGPCDLQPRRPGSRSSQAEHAVCELPAGRVRSHHFSSFPAVPHRDVNTQCHFEVGWHLWESEASGISSSGSLL